MERLLIFASFPAFASASVGDRSALFQNCMTRCKTDNCSLPDALYVSRQPLSLNLLKWTCPDECSYECMWRTVEIFQKENQRVPQFFGKWPFVRLLGVQEPASALFSVFNAIPSIILFPHFRRKVPPEAPMYWLIHFIGLCNIHTWFWSTVFHSRDFPFTERMDYLFTVANVFALFFAFIARVLGTTPWWKSGVFALGLLAFFAYHCWYMVYVRFDYGYNMKVNVGIGVLNAVGWLVWCAIVCRRQPYVWKMAVVIITTMALLSLELWDFPPIWWTFDAHSLWHLGTSPLGFLFMSFAIEDCQYMLRAEKVRLAKKKRELEIEGLPEQIIMSEDHLRKRPTKSRRQH